MMCGGAFLGHHVVQNAPLPAVTAAGNGASLLEKLRDPQEDLMAGPWLAAHLMRR